MADQSSNAEDNNNNNNNPPPSPTPTPPPPLPRREPEEWELLEPGTTIFAAHAERVIHAFEEDHPERGPQRQAYKDVVQAYGIEEVPQPKKAERLTDEMHDRDMEPEATEYGWVIHGYGREAASEAMAGRGRSPSSTTWRSGRDEAHRIVEKMKARGVERTTFVYNCWIIACCREGSDGNPPDNKSLRGGSDLEGAMEGYRLMKEEGLEPDVQTFNGLITAISRSSSSSSSSSSTISRSNLEVAFDLYAEMKSARIEPSIITFTALITCCSRCEGGSDVSRAERILYEEMVDARVSPNEKSFGTMMTVCSNEEGGADWEKTEKLYRRMKRELGIDKIGERTYNIVLHALSRCNPARVDEALDLFWNDMVPRSNRHHQQEQQQQQQGSREESSTQSLQFELTTYTVNTLLDVLSRERGGADMEKMIKVLNEMDHQQIQGNTITMTTVLTGCSRQRGGCDWKKTKELYDKMTAKWSTTCKPNLITMNTMITVCSRCSPAEIEGARWVMTEIRNLRMLPDLPIFNMMMTMWCRVGKGAESMEGAMRLYEQMKRMGIVGHDQFYTSLITACVGGGRVWRGVDGILGEEREDNSNNNNNNSRSGDEGGNAEELLSAGPGQHDSFVDLTAAMNVYRKMQEAGIKPTSITFRTLLYGCSKTRPMSVDVGKRLWADMRRMGIRSDNSVIYCLMIKIFSGEEGSLGKRKRFDRADQQQQQQEESANIEGAMSIYRQMVDEDRIKPDVITLNSLITCISRCDRVDMRLVEKIYNEMVVEHQIKPDVFTFNSLINCISRCDRVDMRLVEKIYNEMVVEHQIKPNDITINTILSCCARVRPDADKDRAVQIWKEMEKHNIHPNIITLNNLLQVLRYCQVVNIDAVDEVLQEMRKRGIREDSVTFSTVLMCFVRCRRFEDWKRGVEYFDSIERRSRNGPVYSAVFFLLRDLISFCEEGKRRRDRDRDYERIEEEIIRKLRDVMSEARENIRPWPNRFIVNAGREAVEKIFDYRPRREMEDFMSRIRGN